MNKRTEYIEWLDALIRDARDYERCDSCGDRINLKYESENLQRTRNKIIDFWREDYKRAIEILDIAYKELMVVSRYVHNELYSPNQSVKIIDIANELLKVKKILLGEIVE